jgi:hypothetical protein
MLFYTNTDPTKNQGLQEGLYIKCRLRRQKNMTDEFEESIIT